MVKPLLLINDLCRLCLDKTGVKNIIEIEKLSLEIHVFTGIEVCPSDELPQKVCENCLEIIANMRKLRYLAKKNDSYLKCLLDDSQQKNYWEITPDELVSSSSSALGNTEHSDAIPNTEQCTRLQESSSKDKENTGVSEKQNSLTVRKDLFYNEEVVKEKSSKRRKAKKRRLSQSASSENHSPNKKRPSEKGATTDDDDEDGNSDEYKCETCSKIFDKHKKLYMHMRVHNKSIACPIVECSKMFATKSDLERHLRVHTGVKPFHCDLCDSKFTQKVTLKNHIESLHQERCK